MEPEHSSLDDASFGSRVTLPRKITPPAWAIIQRILIAVMCLVLATAVVYFDRDGYRDAAGGEISVIDALYYATVSLSTTGYGDISPVTESARLINILVITPLRFLFLIVLVGTTIEVLTQGAREQWRNNKWRDKVKDHTVVVGFGVKGRSAVSAMLDAGVPSSRIVVVVSDALSGDEANRMGLATVVGDGRREEVLHDAGIERADRVIVATDADDTSVLVTLTARRLAPEAQIVSAARESANAQILRDSGADRVIVTAEAAGRLLSMSLLSKDAGELMEDLLDSGRGLELIERTIAPEELGLGTKDLEERGEIVLGVIRDGQMQRFDQNTVRVLQRNDRVVVIRERPGWVPEDNPTHT